MRVHMRWVDFTRAGLTWPRRQVSTTVMSVSFSTLCTLLLIASYLPYLRSSYTLNSLNPPAAVVYLEGVEQAADVSRLFLFGAVKKHFDSCRQSMVQLCTAQLIWIPLLLVASHSITASPWSLVVRCCLFDLGMDRLCMDLMNEGKSRNIIDRYRQSINSIVQSRQVQFETSQRTDTDSILQLWSPRHQNQIERIENHLAKQTELQGRACVLLPVLGWGWCSLSRRIISFAGSDQNAIVKTMGRSRNATKSFTFIWFQWWYMIYYT